MKNSLNILQFSQMSRLHQNLTQLNILPLTLIDLLHLSDKFFPFSIKLHTVNIPQIGGTFRTMSNICDGAFLHDRVLNTPQINV